MIYFYFLLFSCGECEELCFFYNTISNCFISVKEIHWKRATLFPVEHLLHREKKYYERDKEGAVLAESGR
jgi:hypothetical protein